MNLHLLLCVAMLLSVPALAQTGSILAASAPKTDEPMPEIRVECTPAAHASDLIGQHGCVAGRVSRITYTHTGAAHVSLCPTRSKCSFHVVARAHDSRAVGDLSYLRGRIVAVVGDVTEYRGHSQILIKDRGQIQVAAGGPPSEFDVDQAKATGKGSPASKRGHDW